MSFDERALARPSCYQEALQNLQLNFAGNGGGWWRLAHVALESYDRLVNKKLGQKFDTASGETQCCSTVPQFTVRIYKTTQRHIKHYIITLPSSCFYLGLQQPTTTCYSQSHHTLNFAKTPPNKGCSRRQSLSNKKETLLRFLKSSKKNLTSTFPSLSYNKNKQFVLIKDFLLVVYHSTNYRYIPTVIIEVLTV